MLFVWVGAMAWMLVAQQEPPAPAPLPQPAAAQSEEEPAWSVELRRRREALVEKNGPGTNAALRNTLLAMKEEDQAAPERGLMKVSEADRKRVEAAARAHATDDRLTAELKEIYAKNGWPVIAMVGLDASNAAMILLTHTRDHDFQRKLLPQLEKLAEAGRIDGSALAVMVDKELLSEHLPQRYGTQFKVVDGGLAMVEVEDAARLDVRRAEVFLPPLAEYKRMLAEMYHLPATDNVVTAK